MRRRVFVGGCAGALASLAWPSASDGQPRSTSLRRIGVLTAFDAGDPEGQVRLGVFRQRLEELGWTETHNLKMDYRWGANNVERGRAYASELVALEPDVLFATGGTTAAALVNATRTVPIVFANVPDPVGSGLVETLARPGGNATGFMLFEYSLSGKWPELLKEIAPDATRVGVVRDPALPFAIGQYAVIQSVAPSVGLEVSAINLAGSHDLERAVAAFARSGAGGFIVTASAQTTVHRDPIIALAARYKLPTVYCLRFFVSAGGLISYGPNLDDQHRGAADYIHRVLRGEMPADMPVQAPTRYELAINLRTAQTLGLAIPPSLLARADEVIE